MLTRTLLAWELTGEATSLAYINLVGRVASYLCIRTRRCDYRSGRAPPVSHFRTDPDYRKRIIYSDSAAARQAEFWHMLCTAFVAGCAFPFIMPARMAITMKVVGSQRLQRAVGFQSGAMNLNRILGPAVMGLIVAQFSYEAAYYLSTALYSLAIVCMFRGRPQPV